MTASSEQRGSDAAPVPEGADQAIDAQLWKALIGGDAKARAAAATRIGERGENAAYAAALAQAAEDDGTYSFPRRRAAGTALGLLGDPRVPSHEPVMLRVAGGPFRMGTLAEDQPRIIKEYKHARVQPRFIAKEMPQHEVEVAEFEIGKYPVTNREYAEFVEATGQPRPASWTGPTYPEGKSNHPVVRISHEDAVAYAEWLAKETGRPVPAADRGRVGEGGPRHGRAVVPVGQRVRSGALQHARGQHVRGALQEGATRLQRRAARRLGRRGQRAVRRPLRSGSGHDAGRHLPERRLPVRRARHGRQRRGVGRGQVLRSTPATPSTRTSSTGARRTGSAAAGAWNRPGDVARTARRHGNFVGVGSIGLRLARDVRA